MFRIGKEKERNQIVKQPKADNNDAGYRKKQPGGEMHLGLSCWSGPNPDISFSKEKTLTIWSLLSLIVWGLVKLNTHQPAEDSFVLI